MEKTTKKFYDKNGKEIHIGNTIRPDEGLDLLIVSQRYVEDYQDECLFGQQVLDPMAFSILDQDNLSLQWSLIEEE